MDLNWFVRWLDTVLEWQRHTFYTLNATKVIWTEWQKNDSNRHLNWEIEKRAICWSVWPMLFGLCNLLHKNRFVDICTWTTTILEHTPIHSSFRRFNISSEFLLFLFLSQFYVFQMKLETRRIFCFWHRMALYRCIVDIIKVRSIGLCLSAIHFGSDWRAHVCRKIAWQQCNRTAINLITNKYHTPVTLEKREEKSRYDCSKWRWRWFGRGRSLASPSSSMFLLPATIVSLLLFPGTF